MTWGLVFSGGAAWGIANGGVAEVLEREELKPDCISGSSMGAIVGALMALGKGPDDLRGLCGSLNLTNVATLSAQPFKGGLHGGLLRQRLHDILEPIVGDATVGDCTIPFACVAGRVKEPIRWERIVQPGFTDYLRTCVEPHVFGAHTPLLDALLATSAVPVLFSPVKIDGSEFIDLVHFGAIPARTMRDRFHPDVIVATDTNPRHEEAMKFLPPGWKEFLHVGHAELEESRRTCDLIIQPTLTGNPFRFDKAKEFYEAGKKAAEAHIAKLHALFEQ